MIHSRFIKSFFIVLTSALLFAGIDACKKDTDTFIPTGTTTTVIKKDTAVFLDFSSQPPRDSSTITLLDIEKMIDTLRSPMLKDTIADADNGGNISKNLSLGTLSIICPGKGFLQKPNGAPCKGKLNIDYQLLTTKTDLILNDMPTVSDGYPLVSGGVVRVHISQNGAPVVFARSDIKLTVYYQAKYDGVGPMSYFEGQYNSRTSFNWKQFSPSTDQQAISVSGRGDSSIFRMVLDRFTFVNCDRFYNDPNLIKNFSVKLPPQFSNQNSAVYVAYKDIFTVLKLDGDPTQRAFIIPKYSKGFPDKAATVVTLSLIKGKYYLATQSLTNLSTQSTVSLTPTEITFDEIKTKLKTF